MKMIAASLRLVFPTLQKNDSPLTILPGFVNVLGKKLEAASVTQDMKPKPVQSSNICHIGRLEPSHVSPKCTRRNWRRLAMLELSSGSVCNMYRSKLLFRKSTADLGWLPPCCKSSTA